MTKLKLVGLLLIFVQIALVMASLQIVRSRAALRELTAAVQELLTANEELRTACAAQTAACSKQTTAPSAGTPVGMDDTDWGKGTWSGRVRDGATGFDFVESRPLVKCLTDAEIAALPDRPAGSVLVDRRGNRIVLASCDK